MATDGSRGRLRAAAGTSLFLAIAPGTVAGLIPWLLTRWSSGQPGFATAWRIVGGVVFVAGGVVLLHAFLRFVVEGIGTPAPTAPTERLVVGGLYRYVRNPMYLAVGAAIVGQGLLLSRPILLLYAAIVTAVNAAFVRGYEEPTLRRQFGEDYDTYRQAVPAWLPRCTPWPGDRQWPGRPG